MYLFSLFCFLFFSFQMSSFPNTNKVRNEKFILNMQNVYLSFKESLETKQIRPFHIFNLYHHTCLVFRTILTDEKGPSLFYFRCLVAEENWLIFYKLYHLILLVWTLLKLFKGVHASAQARPKMWKISSQRIPD